MSKPKGYNNGYVVNKKILSIISMYCPKNGRNKEDKNQFCNELNKEIMARY